MHELSPTTVLLGVISHAAGGGKRQFIGDTSILAADGRLYPFDDRIRQETSEVFFHSDDAPLTVK